MKAVTQRQRQSILKKAQALSGGDLGPQGEALVEMACHAALSRCCREDIPEEMEQAVAALVLTMTGGGVEAGAVKSIQRGDTAITYAAGGGSSAAADAAADRLAPWRRLGTVREGRA